VSDTTAVVRPVPAMDEIKAPPRTNAGLEISMLPFARLNEVAAPDPTAMATVASPKGTLAVGETTNWLGDPTPKVPAPPTVTAGWLVVTPPTVMLFAAIVPAVNPWPSMSTEVGAVPRKLKVVRPYELLNATHGVTVKVAAAENPEVVPVAVMLCAPPVWSRTLAAPTATLHAPSPFAPEPVLPAVHEADAVLNIGNENVTVSPAAKPVTDTVVDTLASGKPVFIEVDAVWDIVIVVV
jgi:hypothetical protein